MHFAFESDLEKMTTVSQFGYFLKNFCHFEGSYIRGGFLRWFPPYMKKAPLRVDSNARCEKNRPQKTDDSIEVWPLWEGFFVTLRGPI